MDHQSQTKTQIQTKIPPIFGSQKEACSSIDVLAAADPVSAAALMPCETGLMGSTLADTVDGIHYVVSCSSAPNAAAMGTTGFLEDRDKATALANLASPWVRAIDPLVGERVRLIDTGSILRGTNIYSNSPYRQ